MKLAVLSDIHGNAEALNRCLEYIDAECSVDEITVLGDIVGYGADPGICIQQVKKRAAFSVLGNHDAGVIGKTDIRYFNYSAQAAILWTQARIQEDERKYLNELPYSVIQYGIRFVHSSPNNPEYWKYIISWYDTADEFSHFPEKVCFIGHSHIPGIYTAEEFLPVMRGEFKLEPDTQYIINPGSVGQPRDGDPRLSFGIFDTETTAITIIRQEYDVETARQKIIDNNLPAVLGDRLLYGQ